jgi:uncharacterized protein (TIGR03084 family)
MSERTDVVTALRQQQAELESLVDHLSEADWSRPSPCEGWDVADVVLHLAQTDELAAGSLRGQFDAALARLTDGLPPSTSIDDGAAAMVANERDIGPSAIVERHRASVAELADAIGHTDLSTRVQWVAGELSARTLVSTRLAETWIHTGDVADALGVALPPTDRLWHIARLAWRTLPYAFARAGQQLSGPVALILTSPSGETWSFSDGTPATTVTGDAFELCRVAGRRLRPEDTSLTAAGPDGPDVLRLIRTYA